MNVPIFFYLADIVILFVGIPQTPTPLVYYTENYSAPVSLLLRNVLCPHYWEALFSCMVTGTLLESSR